MEKNVFFTKSVFFRMIVLKSQSYSIVYFPLNIIREYKKEQLNGCILKKYFSLLIKSSSTCLLYIFRVLKRFLVKPEISIDKGKIACNKSLNHLSPSNANKISMLDDFKNHRKLIYRPSVN